MHMYPPGVFEESLSPALDAYGLDGTFRVKERQNEGLATFYRRLAPPTTTPRLLIGRLSMASILDSVMTVQWSCDDAFPGHGCVC